jgi:hypothetical protein
MKREHMQNVGQLVQILALQWLLVGLAALSSTFAATLGLVPFFVVARMATAVYAEPPRLAEVSELAVVALAASGRRQRKHPIHSGSDY